VQPEIGNNLISPLSQILCGDTDTAEPLIGLLPVGGGGSMAYQWQIRTDNNVWEDIENIAQNYQPTVGFQGYGERFFRRLVTSGKCEGLSNEVMVRIDEQPYPHNISLETLNKDFLGFTFQTTLEAAVPNTPNSFGTWSSDDENLIFSAPNSTTTTVSNLQFGENTIYWNVSNETCAAPTQSVTIHVLDVEIPSGLSPNNDGDNDCFWIKYGENATSSKLVILDRHNNIVFESDSFVNDGGERGCTGWWDGRSTAGRELPSGTYFYQLTLNGDRFYRGYVVLKRE